MVPRREFVDGATAIARGALDAGCDFFAGYPITPASGILAHMLRELPKAGGVGIQGEDEIASLGFCLGAAAAGATAMTASSGPGLSLYSENLGAAIMTELPLVVVIVQRVGPATGAATTGAQGDVQFIRWGTSGGYPILALAPTDVAECYHLTRRAFALARRFRLPVFVATDKDVVMTTETVAADAFAAPPADWPPVPADPLGAPVPVYAGAGAAEGAFVRFNASSHDARGYITKDPVALDRLNRHLAGKVEDHLAELELVHADLQPGARTLFVSFGVTARSVAEAVALARSRGQAVSALTVYSLWPVPEQAIREALAGIKRVVVPELNLGQYRREIERLAAGAVEVVGVNRVDGLLITPEQLLAEVHA
jgi:2-oxoglutarate/2-oxoacid ferredoxin oxidoreductase subunit alpha